ncbi:hypothetical protein B4U84_23600, partial [Westiellopsis prolifica IICB1]
SSPRIKDSLTRIKDSSPSIKDSLTSIKDSSPRIKDSLTSIKDSSAKYKYLFTERRLISYQLSVINRTYAKTLPNSYSFVSFASYSTRSR